MFCEIRFIEFRNQLSQIFICEEYLCLTIVFQLANLSHWIFANHIILFQPVEEYSDVANIVVDCGDADWFAIIPSTIWIVLFLRKIIDIEGVFSSLLKVIDILANQIFCDLVDAINLIFVGTPSLK